MKIGFIGLGSMGSAMAPHLIAAGKPLTVHNRTEKKAESLISDGAEFAHTPGGAAQGEIVITMLADDAAVEATVFGEDGILQALPKGATHISMSTISVALAERLAAAHAEAGQGFVSAPVFGRPDAAAAGKLFIVAAGPAEVLDTCQPVLEMLGQRTFFFGEEAAKANLVKLSGNFLIASTIESLAEAFALVGKAGIDRHAYLELLTETLFSAPIHKTYGGLIADERYTPPGFTAQLGHKDMGLALDAAEELQVPMGMASLVSERFLTLMAAGAGDLDWSALGKLAKRDAGDDDAPLAAKG
ncbi:2-hydroxy-3-oxopropionate reductase [Methyloligella halotolerans]|uniref:2-hydroxy-3-oxopropionate reductase n=1 Tax=Methyloligella halotolerans TaxID=1177755 RepID=A0A1E2S2G3_9HYPH|nr:NAD(P)-dependent oxidoreductase [Methyloligella halotolerans]ODA68602.1 2-hydroxy-3-oxopropionate reductase [Methyloligella halotolerans]